MKNRTFLIVGILAVVISLFFVFGSEIRLSQTTVATPTTEIDRGIDAGIKIPSITLPFSKDSKDIAWALFQKYLDYNKNQDLNGIKSVVYKVAPVCSDVKTIIDCKSRMGLAYKYGSSLRKEDFVNIWQDEKQIILSTDFWLESSKEMDQYGRFRSIIYFVKDKDGDWKILSFSPAKGGATIKSEASQEEVDARIIRYTEDNDKDGIADYEEECLNRLDDTNCIKTDPKTRDTDGDGLWDGIETLMI